MGCVQWWISPTKNAISIVSFVHLTIGKLKRSGVHAGRFNLSAGKSANCCSFPLNPSGRVENEVRDRLQKQVALVKERRRYETHNSQIAIGSAKRVSNMDQDQLNEVYALCGEISAAFSKSFHWGTLLLPPESRNALWAINVWCQRLDDLVDSPMASHISPATLDECEKKLIDLYEGRPHDILDAALFHTVSTFPIEIQLFKDMIEGMKLDLVKKRYENFDELYHYCYCVAGTVGLMSIPVLGIEAKSEVSADNLCNAALSLGIANQLTNILRDVGEDAAKRGRIYLPQDELARAGLSEDDIFSGKVTEKWRIFMRAQISRARMFFDEAEKGISGLDSKGRWAVWLSMLIYRQILDAIESNDYDNLRKRASVGTAKKLMSLPIAYAKARTRLIPIHQIQ